MPSWAAVWLVLLFWSSLANAQVDLTGFWGGDDNGVYYLRQRGDVVWWVGLSTESPVWGEHDFHRGLIFTNVLHGRVTSPNTVVGDWADVPRGSTLGSGTLTLQIWSPDEIRKQAQTSAFGATVWRRIVRPIDRANVLGAFLQVQRNDRHSMASAMRGGPYPWDNPNDGVYRNDVVVRGQIADLPMASFPGDGQSIPRQYPYFMCADYGEDFPRGTKWFDGPWFSDPPDGDINLNVGGVYFSPNFWTEGGWFRPSQTIHNRFAEFNNEVHVEFIMFGKAAEVSDCDRYQSFPSLLPGWSDIGANSILLNGIPLSADVSIVDSPLIFTGGDGGAVRRILNKAAGPGREIDVNTPIRVTGVFGLDEHGNNRPEIHPVYSIEVFQDFGRRQPTANLTGAWDSIHDDGLYYVRQVGNSVWWLGLSSDAGRTFANVFHGMLDGPYLRGEWSDVPLGYTDNSGTVEVIALRLFDPPRATTLVSNDSGVFRDFQWDKIYDVVPPLNLAVTRIGGGTVTSSPTGISCGGTCSALFEAGATVYLNTSSGPDWIFRGWSGACSGYSCDVFMDGNKSVTATFEPCVPSTSCTGLCGRQPDGCGGDHWCGECPSCPSCGTYPDCHECTCVDYGTCSCPECGIWPNCVPCVDPPVCCDSCGCHSCDGPICPI